MNNKVTVEILGVKYPLRYSKDSDINDIQEAAKIVDENIRLMTKQNQYLPPDSNSKAGCKDKHQTIKI